MNQLTLIQKLFVALQHCLPQHTLSRITGKLANSEQAWLKNFLVKLFIRQFNVDMTEAAEPSPENYASFNAFFTRALRDNARPVDTASNAICSPADGCISQLGNIRQQSLLQAKGMEFELSALLGGNTSLAEKFHNGRFMTVYLSPRDYHRVHMPCDGELVSSAYIPGKLFSVNTTTTLAVDQLFARNERLVCEFETPYGPMVMVLVGAMIVAGIEALWKDYSNETIDGVCKEIPDAVLALKKGEEMGRFKLGSTVIMLFGEQAIHWQEQLKEGSPLKMGEKIAITA